jgi:5-methylcytosine-specific restriction endonuclease McrA
MKGKKNPSWKGGYAINGIPTYNEYAHKLTIEEDPKRDLVDENILTVICSFSECKKRFIPRLQDVQERIRALYGKNYGEQRLYCSEECKNKCPIFNKHSLQDNHPKKTEVLYSENDYQTFRKFVLERDNHICQFCGKKATDVHHEKPKKLEPFFALDPDYAWSCCEKCHSEKGHKKDTECSTNSLAKINC